MYSIFSLLGGREVGHITRVWGIGEATANQPLVEKVEGCARRTNAPQEIDANIPTSAIYEDATWAGILVMATSF